ncbi:flagellar hook-basal body complex protein FliE [Arenibacterium halophilum]|uniref:Flagellar hook-basal body complex protein FliE n=1 Tax=Arenibacterium halophilum TaxID=2583821 RepID=A0ABY2X688_9RHOB|nr:flagellar hook-basal body complex protein FliE [Arenibacterium halophilum]TMV10634.1 flagellar hook-basal body complex protein FliE [Arenibacterium halophilum]
MEIQNLSAVADYAAAREATKAQPAGNDIGAAFAGVARDFAATLKQGETQAMSAMTGDADPHSLVQALAQTELAVETAVSVRNKVVEAYQEILRMPV